MSLKLKLFALAAVFTVFSTGILFYAVNSGAEKIEHWITVDRREFSHVQKILNDKNETSLTDLEIVFEQDGLAVLRLNETQMENLSRGMHEGFHKCSGFMAHTSYDAAVDSIRQLALVDTQQQFVDYTIDNQTNVNALLAEASEPQNRQVILDLSAFPNRRYNQQSGLNSANWIKDKWTALAAGRSDVTVQFYNHPTATSPQPSIILTIQGTTLPNEIVVLGGHQDSINSGGSTLSAPGADDDASGISCLTEAIRVLMAKGFRPQRTVQFMAYAAEEVGLRGSNAIALDYRNQNKNVVGVMQLDMTNYKGSAAFDIVIFQDFTNAAQNTFIQNLITTYQPTLAIGTSSCGYGCSDHAAWHNRSYPASMPAEATFADTNNALHTVNDTISRSSNNANHALKFSKLALSFVGELAKGAIAPTAKTPFDFDGDRKTDVSIFRPSVGEWWYLRSSDGGNRAFQFGNGTDTLTPADFTGDGLADISFFRKTTGEWFVLRSENSTFYSFPFGANGDVARPADYDGDGKADAGLFRPSNSTWYIANSGGGTTITSFGANGDQPVPADYDGDGKADIAIYRPSSGQWWLNRSSAGVIAVTFGTASDKPVSGDYTGDGKADIAFWRGSTGEWFILRSENSTFYSFPFGSASDVPVAGDYDGDGRWDASVFRPADSNWYIQRTTSGTLIQPFGAASDIAVPNSFVNP